MESIASGLRLVATPRGPPALHIARNLLLAWAVYRVATISARELARHGVVGCASRLRRAFLRFALRSARALPVAGVDARVRAAIDRGLEEMTATVPRPTVSGAVAVGNSGRPRLPERGVAPKELAALMDSYAALDEHWRDGGLSGVVYHDGADGIREAWDAAYARFAQVNPMHSSTFPSVRAMESEVIAMALTLFHAPAAPATPCGNLTSGGTESILVACLAYRELAKCTRGIDEPEMIVPTSAHAAFEKAAHYFGIRLLHASLDAETQGVDVRAVRRLISPNTIMIVGSAPNYPHGIIDDLPALSCVALAHGIPLHVDCCLGSFVTPFMSEVHGHMAPICDFRLPGVTSISVDNHKYGFAPKGVSTIMYRDREIRKHQYFLSPAWMGGIYGSPTLAGSRAGGVIAATWATMLTLGLEGYRESARKLITAAKDICTGIRDTIPELQVIGTPLGAVVAFRVANDQGNGNIDIYALNEALNARGWRLSALQNPPALHIAVTMVTLGRVSAADTGAVGARALLRDLRDSINDLVANPTKYAGGKAALYGMAATIPDPSIVDDLIAGYLDTYTAVLT